MLLRVLCLWRLLCLVLVLFLLLFLPGFLGVFGFFVLVLLAFGAPFVVSFIFVCVCMCFVWVVFGLGCC